VPIHLVISAVVPARSLFGLAVGWFIGALVVLVVGTPGLDVPLEGAVRAMARRGCMVYELKVLRPTGAGPLIMQASCEDKQTTTVMEMYGPHQRGGGVLVQLWHKVRFRDRETAPLHASLRRAVEHRALMAIAIGQLKVANISTIAVAALERSWTLYAHTPARGTPIGDCTAAIPVSQVWESLRELHDCQISHGDLRASEITADETVLFGGFDSAEYGATEAQLRSDIAQLLVTTTHLYDAPSAVRAAIDAFGKDTVLFASRRLTKAAVPLRIRQSVRDPKAIMAAARDEVMSQTRVDEIRTETVTRFTRGQLIQLVLLIALVYVAYPFISSVPTFLTELRTANWWFALLGLAASGLTYLGAAASLWAAADGVVNLWGLIVMQVANKFAATTTPAGVGGLALSARYLQKGGLTPMRATTTVALQQSVQVITHVLLLIVFSTAAGVSANLSRFVPSINVLYLVAGLLLGLVGTFLLVPRLRHWLATAVRPHLQEVIGHLMELGREPKRLAVIVLGCAATTLGNAFALWAAIEAFGGDTSFITVTVVTMIGGTLASAAPTPGGVGAVEAALIGGLAAFGMAAAVAVPSVLLYRVLTTWMPVFVGWQVMRWMTKTARI
jgi:uncharacterized protein (TIRG00374 family)